MNERAAPHHGLEIPQMTFYALDHGAPPVVPARADRDWMDATNDRFAYRCIPLSIANASGWELLCPIEFEAYWNGGKHKDDIVLRTSGDANWLPSVAASHFGFGVLTFHTHFIVRTSPGWATWVRASPNTSKSRIVPLEGLVETDWLPFSFTMNWRFTRVGRVRFEKGEPFCFLTLVPHAILDEVQPVVARIEDAPALKEQHDKWAKSRNDFNAKLDARDPATVKEGWQRHYVQGRSMDGSTPHFHLSKRKLKAPRQA